MRLFSSIALALALAAPTFAQDWPHWRGPNLDGSTEATGLPKAPTLEEGLLWESPLPGTGASTPIVVGERVFLTCVDVEAGVLLAVCLDSASGEERWVRSAGSGYRPGKKGEPTRMHNRSNYASPSAVVDDEQVIFTFGNGDLVSFTLDGEPRWSRNLMQDLGDFALQWTFSTTPTLWKGRLFLPVLQRDEPANGLGKKGAESYLLALDPENGETLYRHVRPSPAVMESLESYATPIPFVGPDGREEILVVGGDVVTGHDPATGKELWRWGTWNPEHREAWWRVVPTPVVGNGVVLACGPKGAPVCAVPLGKSGDLPQDALRWASEGRRDPVTTDVPTPLFYLGDFFVLSDLRNALTRVDADTGEHVWSIDLPRTHKWRASPTGADGRIWLLDHGGQLLIVDADSGEVLHRARFAEEDEDLIRASVVVAGDKVFVRTNTSLFCLGEE